MNLVSPSGKDEARRIAARLDRLPMTGLTWRIVILGSLAWLIESLSIGAMGVVIPTLKSQWHLGTGAIGMLAVASTLGIVIGLVPAGQLADRFGRKTVLFWGIVEYSVLTILAAFSPSLGVLLAIRFLSGLGMGAVFPMPYAITSEFVPKNRRTTFNGIMDSALSAGYFVAPLLGLLILPRLAPDLSWRLFFIVSGLPLVLAFIIRHYLPESPRWLSRRGDRARAEEILAAIEDQVAARVGTALPAPEIGSVPEDLAEEPAGSVLRPWQTTYRRRTVVLAIAAIGTFFMFYIVMTYLPYIFAKEGFSFAHSLLFTAIITGAAIPGKLLNGLLGESLGRKWMYVVFMGVAGVAALFFGVATAAAAMVLYGCVMSFFGTGVFPVLKMTYAEQYPTTLRTTGAATVETLGRFFGGVVGSYGFPALIVGLGLGPSFDLVAVVAFVAVVVMIIYGQESKNQTLETLEARLR